MEEESAAIAAARRTIKAVDRRARKCPEPICRRQCRCMANPSLEYNFHDRRGGCPITNRAEWSVIKLGLQAGLFQALEAVEAVRRVTGETFYQAQKRLLVRHPFEASERRIMLDLWRR